MNNTNENTRTKKSSLRPPTAAGAVVVLAERVGRENVSCKIGHVWFAEDDERERAETIRTKESERDVEVFRRNDESLV